MKAEPLNLILDDSYTINKIFYFISGNEITLMNKVKDLIIHKLRKLGNINIENIKNISFIKNDIGLFNDYKLYIISDPQGLSNEKIEDLSKTNDKYIFFIENNPKTKLLKNIFMKRKDCDLFECYELSRDAKSKIIKRFVDASNLKIDDSLYWGLVDVLDNKYQLLENELKKLSEFTDKNITKKLVEITVTKNSENIERIFFNLLKNNSFIINYYNQKVMNIDDVNKMYFYIKQLGFLFLEYNNRMEFERNIPAYLFREKNFLINLFNKFNYKKKKLLLNLLYNTEKDIRSNGELSSIIGLRFLLKFKKISIS